MALLDSLASTGGAWPSLDKAFGYLRVPRDDGVAKRHHPPFGDRVPVSRSARAGIRFLDVSLDQALPIIMQPLERYLSVDSDAR